MLTFFYLSAKPCKCCSNESQTTMWKVLLFYDKIESFVVSFPTYILVDMDSASFIANKHRSFKIADKKCTNNFQNKTTFIRNSCEIIRNVILAIVFTSVLLCAVYLDLLYEHGISINSHHL